MRSRDRRLAALESAERESLSRLTLAEVEAQLDALDRPDALRLIERLPTRHLEALAAQAPELQALGDVELKRLVDGDGPAGVA